MKYTDYTPNRSTDQIRADIEMIQSLRPDRKRNKRKTSKEVPDWVFRAALAAAVIGCALCVAALVREILNH